MSWNPFAETPPDAIRDEVLVRRATSGDRAALEDLVRRHQAWIYNLARRMVWEPQVAEDVTQEVLLKVLTRLSTFEGRSRFRTWLYRIVKNHVLDMRHTAMEPAGMTFSQFGAGLESAPDLDLPDPRSVPVDLPVLVEEAKIGCTTAMLLCLDRRQRLVYVLGEIFGVGSDVGAQILEVTREHFRQLLARARRDLTSFMQARCGLVNRDNPCRCRNKTRAFMQRGYVDPHRLRFAAAHARSVADAAPRRAQAIERLTDDAYAALYRAHPFPDPPDQAALLRKLLARPEVCEALDLR